MCKYCEGKEDISDKVYEDCSKYSDSICRVRIYKSEIYGNVLEVTPVKYENCKKYNYRHHEFNIFFCPMCGRKLENKEV